jgi:hypothetical protein
VALARESPSLVRAIYIRMVGVDIKEHLAQHREDIKEIAAYYTRYFTGTSGPRRVMHSDGKIVEIENDDEQDIRQAITLALIERHKSRAYNHHRPNPYKPSENVSLLAYMRPYLRQIAHEALNPYRHMDEGEDSIGNKVDLDVIPTYDEEERNLEGLEEMGRVAPINWHGQGYGDQVSTLIPEDERLAEKIKANLSDEDLAYLDASVGRSEERAAEFLGIPRSTYRYRLMRAKDKALSLVPPDLS